MVPKFSKKDFGFCPRSYCQEHPVLPMGLSDDLNNGHVRLYCGNCEDVYLPPREFYRNIDGAFFGTSFPHLFFLNVPKLLIKGDNVEDKDRDLVAELQKKYVPKVYGYRLHKLWHTVSLQGLDEHNHDELVYGKKQNEEETKGQDMDNIDTLKEKVQEQEREIQRLKALTNGMEEEKEGAVSVSNDVPGSKSCNRVEAVDGLSELKEIQNRMLAVYQQYTAQREREINNGLNDGDIASFGQKVGEFGSWLTRLENSKKDANGAMVMETEGK